MKKRIEALLAGALERAALAGELRGRTLPPGCLEVPKDRQYGDLAANLAMALARSEGKPPRAVAETVVRHIDDPHGVVAKTEIAGPGFINFTLAPRFWHEALAGLLADETLGVAPTGVHRYAQVEFVSANPTGPLTVGHGRNAVLGDSIARLLEAVSFRVEREYYFNNAGRQMKVLGDSVRARYQELVGRPAQFPEDGYQGDYIREIAKSLVETRGASIPDDDEATFRTAAESAIFADIRATQERLGIHFDHYFNEDSLYRSGAIDKVISALDERGLIVRRDGAVWLCGEKVGLDKDRVLIKSTGEPAYRLPDIAYHKDKLRRGFDLIVDVLGADHIAEHREVAAALAALGCDTSRIRPVIYQFVTLTRHGEQVKMSTRRAEYVTLDELLDEVGSDAARFFFLMRKSDSHLEFDLELAKKRTTDNPVFYVQYAHARIMSLYAQARAQGVAVPHVPSGPDELAPLALDEEFEIVRLVSSYGEVVEVAARELEPHRIVFYLQELAAALHRFYNHHRVLGDEAPDRMRARLALLEAVRRVLVAGLTLLGVTAPERM